MFLLGCKNGAQMSRYEKRHRLPPLHTALAFEAIFGVPVAELFAGIQQAEGDQVAKRLRKLAGRWERALGTDREARMLAQKRQWLTERYGLSKPSSP